MMTYRQYFRAALLSAILPVLSAACSTEQSGAQVSPGRQALSAVSLPDLSRVDPGVQAQARERHATLTARMKDGSGPTVLGTAYGELGMLLQAAEFYEAAEPYLLNAQLLMPAEIRWPYYLAHQYNSRGMWREAEAAFNRVLELRADDLATLVWLGRLHLDQGNVEEAAGFFRRAYAIAPQAIAVLAGLGRIDLANRDYAGAVERFERALEIDPAADSVHAPLAVAYRALGDQEKAGRHERQWSNRDILVPDPLSQELDMLLDSGLSNELRGVRALEAGDWKTAAGYFQRGLQLTSENSTLRRSLQHKLGTALHLAGDEAGAVRQFEEVVKAAPSTGLDEPAAKAHYSVAVSLMSRGRTRDAVKHFQQAVRYQPSYAEARLALAEVLRRTGRVGDSLQEYSEALALNPRAAQARFGQAMALIRLERYLEARSTLVEAVAIHPDRPELTHTLARLLAVAPDARARDGQRAMQLVQELLKGTRTTELGETLAMTLAELGEYEQAVRVQHEILAVARKAGAKAEVHRIERNLRLYENRQPCRTFWAEDER